MAKERNTSTEIFPRHAPPAKTPEGREQQLVSLAMDLVEKRMRDGTASAQETVHFLRVGSTSAVLDRNLKQQEELLLSAKIDQLESQKRIEDLFAFVFPAGGFLHKTTTTFYFYSASNINRHNCTS